MQKFPSVSELPRRTLDELKSELLARAQRNAYPLTGLKPDDVKEAANRLRSLGPNEWADEWITIGDRYLAQADEVTRQNREAGDKLYLQAWRCYAFGSWPVPNADRKQAAYGKALAAFRRHLQLQSLAAEIVELPYEGRKIVGYLRLPESKSPAPLVLAISGLDSRKEHLAERFGFLAGHGVASFAIDAPGTGEAPIAAGPTSERMYVSLLDELAKRPEVDRDRIAVYGGSFGGHWATKLAFAGHDRIKAVIAQSPGIHLTYQPEQLHKLLQNREYLFDLIPAQMTVFEGVATLEDLADARAQLSLLSQGRLQGPAAPMLVIAGVKDTQTPFEDIQLLLRSGDSPKESWINPRGGHMGREPAGWTDATIFKHVTTPWLLRNLGTATSGQLT
jgi:pimeloyl-ACP methyl ester carboxylesterase